MSASRRRIPRRKKLQRAKNNGRGGGTKRQLLWRKQKSSADRLTRALHHTKGKTTPPREHSTTMSQHQASLNAAFQAVEEKRKKSHQASSPLSSPASPTPLASDDWNDSLRTQESLSLYSNVVRENRPLPLDTGAARKQRSSKLRRAAEYCDFLELLSSIHQRNMGYELGYRCLMESHADDMRAFRGKLLRNFRQLMHRLRALETKGVLSTDVTETHMASYAFSWRASSPTCPT